MDLSSFDALLFHSPFCKLVQKSLARLSLNDFKDEPSMFPESLQSTFSQVALEDSYFNKEVEKSFMDISKATFENKTQPSLNIATNVGNTYTASLYGGLVSFLVSHETAESLVDKRVALFSYGSGLASSFFSIKIKASEALIKMHHQLKSEVLAKLKARTKVNPEDFAQTMKLREDTHHLAPYEPVGGVDDLFADTWYLASVDDKYRRQYAKSGTKN